MRRREFIAWLAGAATWPIAARAQQPASLVIGFLSVGTRDLSTNLLSGIRKGLSDSGFVEGRNLGIEYRWADNDLGRLPEMAADLVRRRVSVIVAPAASAALAAKAATTTIPVVFWSGADAVEAGLVTNLSRPEGNLTGINSMTYQIVAKQIELLHQLLPGARRFGFLINPRVPNIEAVIHTAQAAAAALGRPIEILAASNNREIDAAFASLLQKGVDALVVSPATLFTNRRVQVTTLTSRHAVPTIFTERQYVDIGGLMSYTSTRSEQYQQVGLYVGRILKGQKPSELPVMQPTKFEFVINLQTARTLGIEVPQRLLAQADEVIE
jgi:putative tryptophan/tyrosine transport system substrate-binding protein